MPASLLLSDHQSDPWCCKDLMPPFLPPCAYAPVCCFLRVLSGALIAGRNDSLLPCGCTCNAGQIDCIKCTCNCLLLSEWAVYTLACCCHYEQLLRDQQADCCTSKCGAALIKIVTGRHKTASEDYKTVDSGEEDRDNSGIDQP